MAFAKKLFPKEKLEALEDGSLACTCPPDDELVIGCFAGVCIVAGKEFGIDYPSQLPIHFLEVSPYRRVTLHAMHSVVDWFTYAVWEGGKLQRSLSLSPDSGLLEDIGARLPFEAPYREGHHSAIAPEDEEEFSDYPFAFHPLELGEAALRDLFGYHLESYQTSLDPDKIPLMNFKRTKPWWRWG